MKTAPIVLFVYSRLHHTKKTVQALADNYLADKSHLYVFSDAARNDTERQAVDSVREYIKTITGFYSVSIIEREKNFGLADSIISGVTQVINEHGRAIVLEDDLVTSKFFLRYMNSALEKYKDEEKIMHIAGHMLNIDPTGLPDAFFMRQSSCWGWGTWDRAWRHFQRDSEALLARFTPADISRFNLEGFSDYWAQVRANHLGAMRTWAVFWYASVFLSGGLCLHPRTTMVANIGHDGSGENCRADIRFDQSVAQAPVTEFPDAPKDLWEHPVAMRRYQIFLHGDALETVDSQKELPPEKISLWERGKQAIKCLMPRLIFFLRSRPVQKTSSATVVPPMEKFCITEKTTVFYPSTIVANSFGKKEAIRVGSCSHIRGELLTFGHGGDISIGDYCYVGEGTRIWSAVSIHIGNRVLISHNVNIFDNDTHPIEDAVARHKQYINIINSGHPKSIDLLEKPVVIHDDVLIGCQSIIFSGVTIGTCSVVGAGSVVTKDVPEYCIVAGNPAKVIRKIVPRSIPLKDA